MKSKQISPTFINTECICLFEIGQILTILEENFVCLSKFIWKWGNFFGVNIKFDGEILQKCHFGLSPTPSWPKILHLFPHDYRLGHPKCQKLGKGTLMLFKTLSHIWRTLTGTWAHTELLLPLNYREGGHTIFQGLWPNWKYREWAKVKNSFWFWI